MHGLPDHDRLVGLDAFAAGHAGAVSVGELIAKNAAARGGLDKIQAIKSLKMEGKLRFVGGFGTFDLTLVQYQKAPESVRNEATVQGLTQVQAWDGAAGPL